MKCFLPSSHFLFVCVPRSEVGLLNSAYIWVLYLYPFSQSMSFGWGIYSPLTFKVIIDMYVLIAILLIALDLFLLLFFFPSSLILSSCGLMAIFNVVFELIFLICVCINCRFLVCSCLEVLM